LAGLFDHLKWNPNLGWWSGSTEFSPGRRIDIHVEADNSPSMLRDRVKQADQAWVMLRTTESSIRQAIAEQLVESHNQFCDPEDEVSSDQFADRVRLLSVRFMSSGALELVYMEEGLLGGHWIIVPIGPDGEIGEVSEAG
jgi:hypothetical protein